jgi:DNA-binding NtrC family response regulator
VIVDIFLGSTCGFDLISAMRERAPELAVVAVSGMAPVDAVSRPSDLADVVCLQKPFRPPNCCAPSAAGAKRFPREGLHRCDK